MPVKLSTNADQDGHDEARIEIVPLIDIMFFLLASFMLVSLSMTQLSRVPIELPEVDAALAETSAPPYHFAVNEQGVITLKEEILTPTEVTERLAVLENRDEVNVLIAAHANARHQQVMRLLDAVRSAGIEKVSFESKTPKP
jgi:biopolymer transport protein ExbD